MVLYRYKEYKMDTLALMNAHPRDGAIMFDEKEHKYTVLGDGRDYMSVTTFNKELFDQFNPEKVASELVKNKNNMNDPSYKYYRMTVAEIIDKWNKNGKDASSKGTAMHLDIERFFNGVPVENDSKEYSYFCDFWQDFGCKHNWLRSKPTLPAPQPTTLQSQTTENAPIELDGIPLVPYRTEWMVYYEEYQMSGSIDMLFENPDGTLQIYDWKRCLHISPQHDRPDYPKFGKAKCVRDLPDNHYWHYALQLNMYKRILEAKYGKTVVALYLICLHPTHSEYQRIQLPILPKHIDRILKHRKKMISEKLTSTSTSTSTSLDKKKPPPIKPSAHPVPECFV